MSAEKWLVLVGPSAVGKTTVMTELLTRSDTFSFVRSLTTRPPRFPGDGEYLFVTREAFETAKSAGRLLEYTEYADCAYATPFDEIGRIKNEGKTPLLILDLAGAKTLKTGQYAERVFTVYLYDKLAVTAERLRQREAEKTKDNAEAEANVRKRTAANRRDFEMLSEFAPYLDALVKNDKTPAETADAVTRLFDLSREGKTGQSSDEKRQIVKSLKAESEAAR